MVLVCILLLIGEVLVLARSDRVMFGTWMTPFTFLAAPATAVIAAAFLFAPALGFIPLRVEAVVVWIVALPVFWIGGLAVGLGAGERIRAHAREPRPFSYENESTKVALAIAWICIPIIAGHLRTSLSEVGGVIGLGTEAFADIYGSGPAAHMAVICTMLFIFLLGTVGRDQKLVMLTIGALASLILVRQVKYLLIVPIFAGIAYRIASGRARFTVTGVAVGVVASFVIFSAAYLIGLLTVDVGQLSTADTYAWLLEHFAAYVFGGMLALGELMAKGLGPVDSDPATTFAPVVNLVAAATSSRLVEAGNEFSAFIAVHGPRQTNVTTMFGPLLIGLGYVGAALYTLALGLASYLLFAVATTMRNCWLNVMWVFVASLLGFGWFGLYFSLLISIEGPVYCALFAGAFSLARASTPNEMTRPLGVGPAGGG